MPTSPFVLLSCVPCAGGGLLSEASDRRSFVDLDLFDAQIRGYLDLQAEIAALRHVCDVDFLHINAQPIKQAMSTWVAKWIYLFTQYLQVGRRPHRGMWPQMHSRARQALKALYPPEHRLFFPCVCVCVSRCRTL